MIKNSNLNQKKISDIYEQYEIPNALREHMIKVAACASLIIDNWTGNALDKKRILRVLLLHDLGNIAKIPEQEITNQKLLIIRKQYIDLCGNDDHLITCQMFKELGLTEDIQLLEEKRSKLNEETMKSDSFERKICAYCDQRVSPQGIEGIKERLEDAKKRYRGKTQSVWSNEEKANYLIKCALEIEKQIMENCNLKPEEINEKSILGKIQELENYEI